MSSAKNRILCVDDNPDSRELVRIMLETNGYNIKCVESPFEALDLLRNEKFDLIILDNWMPGLIGTELTRLIRKFDPATPILFYSAAAYAADKEAALDAGANGYLTKPADIYNLVSEAQRLLSQDGSA